jgi:diadenosine tetraphosphate (Ap4A) HIT family hydrolase
MTTARPIRVIAVDWSGAKGGEQSKIWLAEVWSGRMERLECGRTRDEIIEHLVQEAEWGSELVVGLDFAFSFPEWFCKELGAKDAPAVWQSVQEQGEAWLDECPEPFWGRPGKKRPEVPAHLRRTEQEIEADGGGQPKSVFQIGGGGAVGTGSIRGMPHLLTLREAGFNVWPFQAPRLPLVLEIYPRTLTGSVVKSDRTERERYLAGRFPEMTPEQRRTATGSDDALDAAVSALTMARFLDEIGNLEWVEDEVARLEGIIWRPAEVADVTDVPPAQVEVPWEPEPAAGVGCPFCGMDRVLEKSAHGLAVADHHPVARGHVLVVPRRHVPSIFDLPREEQQDLWALVEAVRGHLRRELEPTGFTVGINDGSSAGQTVEHAHIHVIPRYEGDVPDPRGGVRWVIPSKAAYWDK